VALAILLAGSSATVGFHALSDMARALEFYAGTVRATTMLMLSHTVRFYRRFGGYPALAAPVCSRLSRIQTGSPERLKHLEFQIL
jgi:hypothetical protein